MSRPLTRDEFSDQVGFGWRTLRTVCLEHGIGMQLNGRWAFLPEDVDAAKLAIGRIYDPLPELDSWPRAGSGVYFVQAEKSLFIKIGFTERMYSRLAMLQTDNFENLRVVGFLIGADEMMERELHKRFRADHERGEWFKDSPRLRMYIRNIQ